MLDELQSKLLRWLVTLSAGLIGVIKPTVDLVLVCVIFVFADVYSAWDLSRRVKVKYRIKDNDFGKFSSEKAGLAFDTIIKLIVLILGMNLIDHYLLPSSLGLASYIAVAFCAWEVWSILENFSSENDKSWAKVLQKIMVNKAKRLLDGMDLEQLIKDAQQEIDKENSSAKHEVETPENDSKENKE